MKESIVYRSIITFLVSVIMLMVMVIFAITGGSVAVADDDETAWDIFGSFEVRNAVLVDGEWIAEDCVLYDMDFDKYEDDD